jgi:hypothetical protein
LSVGVHDLGAVTVVEEVDSRVIQSAQVRIGGVIVAANRLVAPGAEAGSTRDGRVGRGHLRNHHAAHRSNQEESQQLILGTFLH